MRLDPTLRLAAIGCAIFGAPCPDAFRSAQQRKKDSDLPAHTSHTANVEAGTIITVDHHDHKAGASARWYVNGTCRAANASD
jgi:hypothetical protein